MALTSHGSPRIEIAWTTSNPLTASPAWESMESVTALEQGLSWNRGRSDENNTVSPGTLSLVLRNDDGAFTPGRAASSRYPNVTIGKRVRVRARASSSAGNFATAENASFEGGTVGNWTGTIFSLTSSTVANSSTRAFDGTKSLLVSWPASGTSGAGVFVDGLTIGRTYTASAYVWVPAGSPSVQLRVLFVAGGTSASAAAWTRVSVTFTATSTTHFVYCQAAPTGAGQQAWVDALQVDEGSAAVTFTTSAVPIYGMFDGIITSLSPVFDEHGSRVVVSASDITAALGDTNLMRSMVEEQILSDGATTYYPLGEPEGSTTAGDVAGYNTPPVIAATQRGSGGTLAFGAGTGPGTDGLSAPLFTPASTTQGLYLSGNAASPTSLWGSQSIVGDVTVEAFVNTSTAADQMLVKIGDDGGSYLSLETTAASKLKCVAYEGGTAITLGTVTSASNVTGGTKHVAVTVEVVGTSATMTLYLDGSSAGTAAWTQSTGLLYFYRNIRVGGSSVDPLFTGTISHVALTPSALTSSDILDHRNAGITGFSGDLSGTRASRILGFRLPTGLISTEAGTSTIGAQDTANQTILDAVQDVAESERGIVFASGSGVVTFHGRAHRYNATTALSVDAETDLGSSDFALGLSDQFLVNDATVTRRAGATARAVNTSSVTAYGTYTQSLSVVVDSDTQAANIATNLANRNAFPTPRVSDLTFDLLTTTTAGLDALLLAAEIGDRCNVTGLPSTAPTTTLQLFIEGVSGSISDDEFRLTFTTSPADTTSVWILGDSTYGVLGSTTRLAL